MDYWTQCLVCTRMICASDRNQFKDVQGSFEGTPLVPPKNIQISCEEPLDMWHRRGPILSFWIAGLLDERKWVRKWADGSALGPPSWFFSWIPSRGSLAVLFLDQTTHPSELQSSLVAQTRPWFASVQVLLCRTDIAWPRAPGRQGIGKVFHSPLLLNQSPKIACLAAL